MHNPMRLALLAALLLSGCGQSHPRVVMATGLGEITLEIYTDKAPITAANFLRHVEQGSFAGASFYRTVTMGNQPDNDIKIEVIQGGIGDRADDLEPIAHETTEQTGILHMDGVISMARYAPGSATTEIFICVGDQPDLDFGGLRNPDGQGFAAFGKVVAGMEVVRAIQQSAADGQTLTPAVPIRAMTREVAGY